MADRGWVHGKAVRIEIEFEDGTVQRLVGVEADKYMQIELDTAVFCHVHGMRIETPKWETAKPKETKIANLEQRVGRIEEIFGKPKEPT